MSSKLEISNPLSDPDVLVSVDNVGKIFCRDFKKSLFYGLKDSARDLVGGRKAGKSGSPDRRQLRKGEFWANEGISFELRRGECLGLIGRNGAGKTTLLKMLTGLIKPDTGSIQMRGKVGALIALGAGFNALLTGRENIYINGSVLGVSREVIDEKLDEIIDFADIREFIDAPVQSYSSGMHVRLGFAIATSIKPDVLIVDEVLAVGDTNFRVKCYNKIRELLPNTAVIFVSHNMFDVNKICTKVTVLNKGVTKFHGGLEDGIHTYNGLNESSDAEHELIIHKEADIDEVVLEDIENSCSGLDTSLHVALRILSKRDFGSVRVRLVFFDETDAAVAEWDSDHHNEKYQLPQGDSKFVIDADKIRLKSGVYRTVVVVTDPMNNGYYLSIEYGLCITIKNDALSGAAYKV